MRLADRFDGFLIDLDGVVYVGPSALDGSIEALAALRALGKGIAFVTNDPFGSRAIYAVRLRGLGFDASPEEIFTAGSVTAAEVAARFGARATVFSIASDAL
jgi:ribonucleotide monophosphatase NagD (HAD superfamily)